MRAAITIVYNGLHHFTHRGFSEFMITNFDLWIIVEGSSKNGGSTYWCNDLKCPSHSDDGTLEYVKGLAKENDNVIVYTQSEPYKSKDEQFNKGVEILKTKTTSCFLWQVDVDEHWTLADIERAEKVLWRSQSNVGSFKFNHYVKHNVIAKGSWGSGWVNRLWKWKGQLFDRHEPAIMRGQKIPNRLPMKFDHYSLCFEQDVKFKSLLYPDNANVYQNWLELENKTYPVHISELFGNDNPIGKSKTYLYKLQ